MVLLSHRLRDGVKVCCRGIEVDPMITYDAGVWKRLIGGRSTGKSKEPYSPA